MYMSGLFIGLYVCALFGSFLDGASSLNRFYLNIPEDCSQFASQDLRRSGPNPWKVLAHIAYYCGSGAQ